MAYTYANQTQNRLPAILGVAGVHAGIGALLIYGLASGEFEKIVQPPLEGGQIELPPPPPPPEPVDQPQVETPPSARDVVAPKPPLDVSTNPPRVDTSGISRIRAADIAQARALGYVIRLIGLSDEEIANAQEVEAVFAPYELAAGMYDGMDEAVQTIGIPNVLVVNADMDEELAYQLTQLLFENTDELIAVHPAANDTTIEFTMSSTPVPLHPGALRYFEEVGAEIPDRLRP